MVDRVYPLKLETTGDGSQTDLFPNELNPNEDAPSVRAVFYQNDTSDDTNVETSRDSSNNMTFKDGDNTTPLTLTELAAGGLPPATEVGQFLYSYNGSTFEVVKPVVTDDGFIVTDDDGHIVVVG